MISLNRVITADYFFNTAVKSKTSAEVINNRPGAGVVDSTLAAEYKVLLTILYNVMFFH